MRNTVALILACAALAASEAHAIDFPQVGDTFDEYSVEEIADIFELHYGEIVKLTVEVEYPMRSDYPDFNAMFDRGIETMEGVPESVIDTIDKASAEAALRQLAIEIPVPSDRIALRDGSLDGYLSALFAKPMDGYLSPKSNSGALRPQSNSTCSFGGASYPSGTVLAQTTCGTTTKIAHRLPCVNGTWVVEAFVAEASERCP